MYVIKYTYAGAGADAYVDAGADPILQDGDGDGEFQSAVRTCVRGIEF
jgi:hypothetical protein